MYNYTYNYMIIVTSKYIINNELIILYFSFINFKPENKYDTATNVIIEWIYRKGSHIDIDWNFCINYFFKRNSLHFINYEKKI